MFDSALTFQAKLRGRLGSASAPGAAARWGARFLFVCLMLASAAWASQGPAPGSTNQGRSPRLRLFSADAVLDRRVSISPRTVYLGEFLDEISRDPDFDLEADDRISNISGYSVTVVVHGRPVRDVMEGLASLFHQPPDRWYWTKERRSGRQVYTLHNTLPPGILRQSESAFVEEFLVAQHAARKEFFSSPPGRRAAMANADPSLRGANKPRSEGFFSFLAGLSDADVRSIIRGRPLHIPTASLSTAQRDFIRNEYRQAFSLNGEDPGQADQLDKVTLRTGGGGDRTVFLDLGKIGGWGVLGGNSLQGALGDRTRRTWVSGDDSLTAEDRSVPAPGVDARPADMAIDRVSRDRLLEKLGPGEAEHPLR